MIWTWSIEGWSSVRRNAYCHNASLCRLIRCQLRVSDHARCADAGLGEDECDAVAEDGLSRLSESDLLESEKETLDCIWSAVFGLWECHIFLFLVRFLFFFFCPLKMRAHWHDNREGGKMQNEKRKTENGKWKMGEKKGSGMGGSSLRWIEGNYSKPVTASRPIRSANEERDKNDSSSAK